MLESLDWDDEEAATARGGDPSSNLAPSTKAYAPPPTPRTRKPRRPLPPPRGPKPSRPPIRLVHPAPPDSVMTPSIEVELAPETQSPPTTVDPPYTRIWGNDETTNQPATARSPQHQPPPQSTSRPLVVDDDEDDPDFDRRVTSRRQQPFTAPVELPLSQQPTRERERKRVPASVAIPLARVEQEPITLQPATRQPATHQAASQDPRTQQPRTVPRSSALPLLRSRADSLPPELPLRDTIEPSKQPESLPLPRPRALSTIRPVAASVTNEDLLHEVLRLRRRIKQVGALSIAALACCAVLAALLLSAYERESARGGAPLAAMPAVEDAPAVASSDSSGIVVTSDQHGIKLIVDDVTRGTLPMSLELDPGRHELRFVAAGHVSLSKSVTVKQGEMLDLGNVKLDRQKGEIEVVMALLNPGATVTIARRGEPLRVLSGPWPMILTLEPGSYTITASKPGRAIFSRQLELSTDKPKREVTIKLP